VKEDFYESRLALSQYLIFHYAPEPLQLPYPFGPRDSLNFPARCVQETLPRLALPARARGCDAGCAVGRSAFELACYCEEVIAVDRSEAFVRAAEELQKNGSIQSEILLEGDRTQRIELFVPPGLPRHKVRFIVGDVLEVLPQLGEFDLLLGLNLLDRVQDPQALLLLLGKAVRSKGWLILSSPYTWLPEYTPRERWLVPGFEKVRQHLTPRFELVERKDLPFLLREHARKYQWCVADVTVWRRVEGS
jgi:putative 4-mercaptohistidine N1-methyltranferase